MDWKELWRTYSITVYFDYHAFLLGIWFHFIASVIIATVNLNRCGTLRNMKKSGLFLSSMALMTMIFTSVVSASSVADPLPAQTIPTDFRFFGSGYGHGVGMSQIGARGQALEGKSAVDILTYYYPGEGQFRALS